MGLNLGTGTAEQAAALVEYCNVEKGTRWSDLRRKHGFAEPYNVKHWCLGNEMDGPWQIGHMTATEYGLKAQDAARQMHAVDPSLKLIACGSSGPGMPTYLEWDREVLEQCYDYVDALSLHRYIGNTEEETGKDSSKYLAMNLSMEKQIAETVAVCDLVRGTQAVAEKALALFRRVECLVSRPQRGRHERPRPGSAAFAGRGLQPGRCPAGRRDSQHADPQCGPGEAGLSGAVDQRHRADHDQRRMACCGRRSTIPTAGRCNLPAAQVLNLLVESPGYEVAGMGQVPYLDVAGTVSAEDGKVSLFVLNRDLSKAHAIEVNWQDKAPARALSASLLTGDDLKAFNSFDAPQKVAPRTLDKPSIAGGRAKFEVPARSYAVIQWGA